MRAPLAVLAAAATTLPLACGDDDGGRGRTVTVPAEPPRAVEIVGDEYFFDPSTIVITGAQNSLEVEIVLDNRGSLAHNVRVFRGDDEVGGTPTFPGGEERSGTARVGAGGYRLVCTVGDHEEQGMTGELIVR